MHIAKKMRIARSTPYNLRYYIKKKGLKRYPVKETIKTISRDQYRTEQQIALKSTINDSQLKALKDLIGDNKDIEHDIIDAFSVPSLEQLPYSKFQNIYYYASKAKKYFTTTVRIEESLAEMEHKMKQLSRENELLRNLYITTKLQLEMNREESKVQ